MKVRLSLALAALLAGAASARAQGTFDNYVAVGDSLTAGFSSGSLVRTHQANSYPALIALQAGATSFEQPLVSEPGIPAELALVSLTPGPVIAPKFPSPGAPVNTQVPRPYNNLGVVGASSVDSLTTTTGGFHDLVLRGMGTAVQQAVAARPTFLTLWIGSNDVLGAAVNGQAIDGVTLVPAATFRQAFTQIVAALRTTGAPIVAANLPDVTSIPFVTTIPPVVVNTATREPVLVNGLPVALVGPNGPLPTGTFVTLGASPLLARGIGIPAGLGGQGTPLPDEVILDPAEVATIRDRVAANNRAIAEICGAAGIPVLDVNALLAEFAGPGRDVGGVTLTSGFLTGGIFSYDGIHLTDLGYAILANEWIALIDRSGARLPLVNLAPYLGLDSRARRAGGVAASGGGRHARPPNPPAVELSQEAVDTLRALFPPMRGRVH